MQASKALLAALALGITGLAQAADEVVVYSSRIDELIKPVFDAYTSKTGVKVKFITDKEAPLMARIKAEGANTPADLLLTVDAGNLWQAEQMGLLQPFKSATIERNIPRSIVPAPIAGPDCRCARGPSSTLPSGSSRKS